MASGQLLEIEALLFEPLQGEGDLTSMFCLDERFHFFATCLVIATICLQKALLSNKLCRSQALYRVSRGADQHDAPMILFHIIYSSHSADQSSSSAANVLLFDLLAAPLSPLRPLVLLLALLLPRPRPLPRPPLELERLGASAVPPPGHALLK